MDILPLSTQSATQTIFVTSTGLEKILVLVGAGTILLLALFGLLVILRLAIKNNFRK